MSAPESEAVQARAEAPAEPPQRILVTGGAGFIGSHVVDALVAAGREVRVLDLLHPLAHAGRPDYLNPQAEYVWGDGRDAELVAEVVRGVDAVCHQAAMVGLGVDFDDVVDYVGHNSLATAVLLRALHQTGFAGRIVLAGSMVVYGEGRYRCPEHGLVTAPPREQAALERGEWEPPCPTCGRALVAETVPESAAPDPRNVYAATKLNQEQLCECFVREHEGSSLASLRYHNVYGSRMPRNTPYAGVASIFRSSLAAGEPPRVFEDGAQIRDFVEVRDVALANRLALDAPSSVAGPFNVASGTPRSIGELAAELARVAGGPEPEVTGEYRVGDVRHVFASIDRARAELGYEPRVEFAAGIEAFAAAPMRDPAGSGSETG